MQEPLYIKIGNWIWSMIQKVYAFFMKPLGGIMLVLVTVIGGAIYGDRKAQSGYDQGMKNQKVADSIYIKQLAETNRDLKSENKSLSTKIDTMRNVDCAEENRKAMAYVESLNREIEAFNKNRMRNLQTVTQENKQVRNEIKTLEKLIPKK